MPSTRTLQSLPNPASECPMVKLDFTNLPNPMAPYYGQASTLRGGDYLFDQLWWTHGVKVPARIRDTQHVNNDALFIPNFIWGTGWVNWKNDHKVDDHNTGGAIGLLLDTGRPLFSTDSRYNQPLVCTDASGEGDANLGSLNQNCPGGGPAGTYSYYFREM